MINHRVVRISLAILVAGTVLPVGAQGLRLPGSRAAQPSPSAAPQVGSQRSADYIVAIVNSEPITNNQVRLEILRVSRQLTPAQQAGPEARELAAQVLERLINDRAQLTLARDSGVKIDQSAIDDAEQNVARQNQMDLAGLHRRLAIEGIDRVQFRNQLRDQLMLTRLRDREVNQKVRVSELDIDRYLLDQQKKQGVSATEINISQVLVALPEDATEAQVADAQAKAQRVLQRAQSGEDFASLARELSAAPDARNGGQLGLRGIDRYPPLFVDATRNLAPGGLVIVRSGAGIHVLKLIEKRAAGMPAVTVAQTHASHILLRPTAELSESAARDRLSEYRKEILAGKANFATLAKEISQDGSAAQGGDLGWASPGVFVPEFEEVMASLAPGQISEPLVSRFGVHLIKVDERRTVELTQREQREAVRAILREKKRDEAYAVWAQDLRGRAYVEMREPPGL